MLIRLLPLLFCVVGPVTSFLNCGFWGFRFFFSPIFFFFFFSKRHFLCLFLPGLASGFEFSLSQANACSGLLSPYVPLIGLLLLFLAWESGSLLGSEERHLTEE